MTKYRAKILEHNAASIQLMQKLGYQEVSRSSVFKEVCFELAVEGEVHERLSAVQLQMGAYDDAAAGVAALRDCS